jgi:hypothetical protein
MSSSMSLYDGAVSEVGRVGPTSGLTLTKALCSSSPWLAATADRGSTSLNLAGPFSLHFAPLLLLGISLQSRYLAVTSRAKEFSGGAITFRLIIRLIKSGACPGKFRSWFRLFFLPGLWSATMVLPQVNDFRHFEGRCRFGPHTSPLT